MDGVGRTRSVVSLLRRMRGEAAGDSLMNARCLMVVCATASLLPAQYVMQRALTPQAGDAVAYEPNTAEGYAYGNGPLCQRE